MNLEREFFDFIFERQNIWHKRFVLKEEPPWTNDEILQKFKIINMYRELDRCTLYIIDKLSQIKDRESLLLNVIFYRFFNRSGLYEELSIEPFNRIDKRLRDSIIQKFSESEGSIFNNAYLISSGGSGKKHENIMNNLLELSNNIEDFVKRLDNSETPEESFKILTEIPMIGPFLACEIWTDLTYFDFFKKRWNDNDFVNIGPGAVWGLNIVYGKKLRKNERQEKLERLHEIQKDMLPEEWKRIAYKNAYSNYPYLSITNIEGALCEFRKYWRLREGKGKKRYFTPV